MNKQNPWSSPDIPLDLLAAKKIVYDKNNLECTDLSKEEESAEYGAYTFKLNTTAVKFRIAKITPTKTGQFVTLWKRIGSGPIQPFDISDPIDLFVVSVKDGPHFGQFIFPKSVLCERGVVTTKNKEGKRAIRVYPPWNKTTSTQAQRTQNWQLNFFLDLSNDKSLDNTRIKKLYIEK